MDNAFSAEIQRVHDLALQTMQECVYIIEADTKQLCPVKTGTLKRSYTSGVDDKDGNITGWVGSNVEYAVWADLKQPHLTAAVDKNQADIRERFKKALGG